MKPQAAEITLEDRSFIVEPAGMSVTSRGQIAPCSPVPSACRNNHLKSSDNNDNLYKQKPGSDPCLSLTPVLL
jgi:hypothetical protein